MKKLLFASVLVSACASTPQPACPKCYAIDEVVPYEPPRRMVILCDEPPDAGAPELDPDAMPDENGPIY